MGIDWFITKPSLFLLSFYALIIMPYNKHTNGLSISLYSIGKAFFTGGDNNTAAAQQLERQEINRKTADVKGEVAGSGIGIGIKSKVKIEPGTGLKGTGSSAIAAGELAYDLLGANPLGGWGMIGLI